MKGMIPITTIDAVADEKRPACIPFYSAERVRQKRLRFHENIMGAPSAASVPDIARSRMEYTYKLDKLLSDGDVQIKTNFKM